MKKITIIGLLSLCAAGVYAQGMLDFFNDISGTFVDHIYAPNPANPTVEQTGNGTTALTGDTPGGTVNWSTFTAIGGSSVSTPTIFQNGSLFDVSLYALGEDNPNANTDGSINSLYLGSKTLFSSLQPVTTYMSTMSTASGTLPAGNFNPGSPSPDPGIPNTGYNDGPNNPAGAGWSVDNVAACSVVCWYTMGGSVTSYAQATTTSGEYYGHSTVFVQTLGIPASVVAAAAADGNSVFLQQPSYLASKDTSFSLIQNVPEPDRKSVV